MDTIKELIIFLASVHVRKRTTDTDTFWTRNGMEGRDPEQKPPEVVFVSSSVAAAASVSVAIPMNCSIDWTSWAVASQPDQRVVQAGGT